MNKLMKCRYLPHQKNITLSNLISKFVEEFVPALHYKYIFMNFRQTSLYRTTYNPSVVPAYLQGRPRSTILHCLHRKASSNKFSSNDIHVHAVDRQVEGFEVRGKSQTYRVDFGSSTGMPSCTYRDWQNYHIPCKHFFGVFQNKEDWTWDKLPDAYLYLSPDGSALTKYLSTARKTLSSPLPQDVTKQTKVQFRWTLAELSKPHLAALWETEPPLVYSTCNPASLLQCKTWGRLFTQSHPDHMIGLQDDPRKVLDTACSQVRVTLKVGTGNQKSVMGNGKMKL